MWPADGSKAECHMGSAKDYLTLRKPEVNHKMSTSSNPYKRRSVDYEVPDVMRTLPGEYYHSEEIYQEELEKIFYKRWLLACRAEEVPEPGDFLTIPVGDESIILVRDDANKILGAF